MANIKNGLLAIKNSLRMPIKADIKQTIINSKKWFRDKLNNLINKKSDAEIEQNVSYAGMRSRIIDPFGRLSFFIYKAKNDEKLLYWDAAPLALLYDEDEEHIYGLNFHYVHPMIRVTILKSLIDYMVQATSERAYINITYNKMRGLSSNRYIKPCLKTYLKKQFQTAPMVIRPDAWHNAIMLPTAAWQRASNNKVWKDSSRKF